MNIKRTAKNSRFVPEAFWIRDWDNIGSLLNEDAVQKLEQAGWTVFWAKLSDHGKTAPLFEGEQLSNWDKLTKRVIVDIYPVADDLKRSKAAGKLCELVGAEYIHSVYSQKGGWMSYEGDHVAIFLPRHQYPSNNADRILQETDGCLAYVLPLSEAQEEIRNVIAAKGRPEADVGGFFL